MTPTPDQHDDTRTFRGRALADVLPRIREELGEDAVIVAQREDAEGGVGGFFAKRVVEIEARPATTAPASGGLLDLRVDEPAGPDALDTPIAPAPIAPAPIVPEPVAHEPVAHEPADDALAGREAVLRAAEAALAAPVVEDETADPVAAEPSFEEHLKALLGQAATTPPPAPAQPPVVAPQVAEVPEPEVVAAPEPVADVAPEVVPEPVVTEVVAAEPESAPAPEPDVIPEPVAEVLPMPAPAPVRAEVVPASSTETAIHDELVDAGLSDALATAVVEETVTHLVPLARDPSLVPLVHKALAARIPTHAVRGAGGRVVGFVGPGGSGKTRCVARLATAYARRSPMPVACVTLRPEDGGAELRDLLSPVGVQIHAEPDAESAARRIAALRDEAIVLVDTPGVSPRAEAELRVLAAELAQLRADEIHVTVPATFAPRAAREIVDGVRPMRPAAIAITHADETGALGTVVELAIDTGLPLSYVGRGHRVDVGLRPADASELAQALLAA